MELEDVPEEVTAVVLSPGFLYELVVEGSSPADAPHATKVARRIAEAAVGAVLDQQTGEIWVRGKLRTPPSVERGLTSIIDVQWYVREDLDPAAVASLWCEVARRRLPEAQPRRYGEVEPLQQKFDDGGENGFVDFVRSAQDTVYFKASKPALGGHLRAGQRTGVGSCGLSLLRAPIEETAWRAALKLLFTEFASGVDAVLATAEVVGGVQWSGRSLSFGPDSDRTSYLAGRGVWAGLPPSPVWWAWFGADYVPLVIDHLEPSQVEPAGDGLFHWRADRPADQDRLQAGLSSPSDGGLRLLFRRGKAGTESVPWLPAELLAVADISDPRAFNPPLTPAAVRPTSLR